MNIKQISIDLIGLSVRSTNALHSVGVNTIEDMLQYNEESLNKIRNLGVKSIKEILSKIEEYQNNEKELNITNEISIPEDFDKWLENEENKNLVTDWLEKSKIKIEALELLSTKSYNILMFSGFEYLYQIAFLSEENLIKISRMDTISAREIIKLTMHYIRENKEVFYKEMIELNSKNTNVSKKASILDIISINEYKDIILKYVKANDIEIENLGLSNRPKNRLVENGYKLLSDCILKTRSEFQKIPAMGTGSIDEIIKKINDYLITNEDRILSFITGDESALLEDHSIKDMILKQYNEVGFKGLSFDDIVEKFKYIEQVNCTRLKKIIGELIADKKLEYVDYRCYRIYEKFTDYLKTCTKINERSREFINKRLQGFTLEAIAQEHGLTRERVRQIVKRDIEKVRQQYTMKTGMQLFDEDYYKYVYETYDFDKKDGIIWLGIPLSVWNYLDLNDIKRLRKDLNTALEDQQGLSTGMRLKIKNYLNRNKLYIDGRWVEKRRSDLEQVVVQKFCKEDVSFDEFCNIYNKYLEAEEIPYDENIYYTESVYRTRKNYLSESRFLLWKQSEQIRYYDIDGRDYTELLDTLNLDSYENIEFSTAKFMREYPEIMKKFDIRDQYELHNLLRKIIPEGSYHDFHCGRMPEIKFGVFDRNAAILDILVDNAPISGQELAKLINEEYGYDISVIMGTYLQPFFKYYHQGYYKIDHKQMSSDNKKILQNLLTDDFYYIDEIRQIYSKLIPTADIDEINPYNLKMMGFLVYSRYCVQNHSSLESFFHHILTKDDIIDISAYRKRFVYVQMFYLKLMELKKDLQIIEFEPNNIINFRKLKQLGITKDIIKNFCDEVFNYLDNEEYFSAQSLRKKGFKTNLYDLGFSDWFYANLLISDDRFSFGTMFGNLILFKGKASITIKSFEINIIQKHGCIDTYDLMNELIDKYGCEITDKLDLIYKVQDTEVYYDKILDRLYANKNIYYKELEEGDF